MRISVIQTSAFFPAATSGGFKTIYVSHMRKILTMRNTYPKEYITGFHIQNI